MKPFGVFQFSVSPYKIDLTETLEKVQKRAPKIVPSCSRLSYSERLQSLRYL